MVGDIFQFDYQRVLSLDLADAFHDYFHFGKYRNMGETLKLSWLFVVEDNKAVLVSRNDSFELVIH